MKMKKIKNLFLAFVFSVVGIITISNNSVKAENFVNNVTNEVYSVTYNENIPLINNDIGGYFVINDVLGDGFVINGYYSVLNVQFSIRNCTLSYTSDYGYLNCAFFSAYYEGQFNDYIMEQELFITSDGITLDGELYTPLPIGASEEELEEVYQEGYNAGVLAGNNLDLLVESCTIVSLEGLNPQDYGYTDSCDIRSSGSTFNAYDNYNSIVTIDNLVSELMPFSDVVLSFDISSYSMDLGINNGYLMFYTKEQTGAVIKLYNDNVLVDSHLIQAIGNSTYSFYSLTGVGFFNRIVIEYEDYATAPHSFGIIDYNTYTSISNYNYVRGYRTGFTAGNESGNNIPGIIGAVFVGPINMLSTIFDFEFLGINLAGFILSLTTLLVVIWLIKRFI